MKGGEDVDGPPLGDQPDGEGLVGEEDVPTYSVDARCVGGDRGHARRLHAQRALARLCEKMAAFQ